MGITWGFDLGTASIGFAVVNGEASAGTGNVIRMGSRIFPEARDKGDDWAPKNAPRRQARLARRQIRRRRWRRVHLRDLLAEHKLLPSSGAVPPAGQDPYTLRAKGLSEALTSEELGWAIFHLLKRRGFQGSRKHEGDPGDAGNHKKSVRKDARKDKDEDQSRGRGEALQAKLGGNPLALYLATIQATMAKPERRRGVGQTRPMVVDELDRLWQAQKPYHPELTDAFRDGIERVALFQRPTYFRQRTIGMCDLEPKEPRALKADWLTQQIEMLQLVNALRLEGGNQRGLDEVERAHAIEYLCKQPHPAWAGLRTELGWKRGTHFTHERGEKSTIRGNRTEAALRAVLGASFASFPMAQAIRDAVGAAWHCVEYRPARHATILEIRSFHEIEAERDRLAARAIQEWQLTPEQAQALSRIELVHGHGRHSVKAMQRLLPALENGEPYATARQSAYPVRESGAPAWRLPGPNAGELHKLTDPFLKQEMTRLIGGIRNPSVLRTLGELQKVVNALLRKHGRPDLIRIEVARELKQSAVERREADTVQADRERRRAAARNKVGELGKPASGPDGDENVLRFLLWQEQGGRCPYSGEMIGCADALSGHATEIDHIFPRSRSADNSQSNKVLCLTRPNRDKGRKTPYEWLQPQSERWAHLNSTVWPAMEKSGWPIAKRRRCQKAFLEDDFSARQLVDTAYVARAAREYLGLLFGGGQAGVNAVQTVPGRATAQLRRAWGLGLGALLHGDETAPKTRDDHRHHAVDALVVAMTHPGSVASLSKWWAERELTRTKPEFPLPWPDLRTQARAWLEKMVVSHRVQAKLTGPLHEDTRLGDTGLRQGDYTLYVKRKAIKDLTPGDVECIRDPGVKRTLQAAIAAKGSLKALLASDLRLPRVDGSEGPVVRRVRLLVKRKDGVMRTHPTRNIHAELGPGTNSHLDVINGGRRISGRVWIKRDALQARHNDRASAEAQPLMTLRPGDVLYRRIADTDEYLLVRKFFGSGAIFYKPVQMAVDPRNPEPSMRPGSLVRDGWRKVSVDPIGCVTPAR